MDQAFHEGVRRLMKLFHTKITRVQCCWRRMGEKCRLAIMRIEFMIFFISDQVNQGNLNVTYCQTDKIIEDSMTYPLQG